MLQLNKVRGDRFSCCLGFGGVDCKEDGAIAKRCCFQQISQARRTKQIALPLEEQAVSSSTKL
jgi:hypothetical protein